MSQQKEKEIRLHEGELNGYGVAVEQQSSRCKRYFENY